MWTLRIILIVIGLACIAGLYFYMRRHPPRREGDSVSDRRIEPEWLGPPAPADAPSATFTADVPPGRCDDRGASGREGSEPPPPKPSANEILSLSVVLPNEGAAAEKVLRTLTRLGCAAGEGGVYHYPGADGRALYSVANLFEPGQLHPLPAEERLRGLVFFFAARENVDNAASFERMLGAARESAARLGGRVEDDRHRPLTAARELELRLAAARHG